MSPRVYTRTDPAERFRSKIHVVPGGCWEWLGGTLNNRGYAFFHLREDGDTRKVLAHRYSYELHIGPIPAGLSLDHICFNKTCVNPEHLEPVTQRENVLRWAATITHCPSGHAYSAENTRFEKEGHKKCRTCERGRERARRLRLKAAA